jgi:two-component system sensor histidine kinase ChiS
VNSGVKTIIPAIKAFEHCSITVKIATSVALLVALAVSVSVVDLYGLKSMQKAVDSAGQASQVLVSVNTVTERVENFIATRDQQSLLKAKAVMDNTVELFSTLASSRSDDYRSITTSLQRFSSAIETLHKATEIMDRETSNMTGSYDRLRKVAIEIEQNIEQQRNEIDKRAAVNKARLDKIQEAQRILHSISDGERFATGILAQRLATDKAVALSEASNASKALLPVAEMLEELLNNAAWTALQSRLKKAVTEANQAIDELIVAPSSMRLIAANEALRHLESIHKMLYSLDSLVTNEQENIARVTDNLRTEIGLLQNSANLSKRFAERVANLEAQTLTFRLSPADGTAAAVNNILEQLTRFSRILPSLGSSQKSSSVLTVNEQIGDYRVAFASFRQASKMLRQSYKQVRQEAGQTASLVNQFANEQRAVAAANRERGVVVTLFTSIIAVLIALLIARHTSRLIARPVVALARIMRRLAAGHLDDEIAGLQRGDEIGSMSRAVKVFQENALRVRTLEAEAEAERQRIMAQLENMVAKRTEELHHKTEKLQTQTLELDKARLQAEAATRAKSEFLANMSHELRTPLNAILGYAHLLAKDTTVEERQRSRLETIEQSGQHLLTLINDLLDLSKIEAGKQALYPVPVNLAASLQTIIDIMQVKAEQKGLVLRLYLPKQLPAAVLLDEKRLRQILLNLLGNAVKFTDSGQVSLRMRSEPEGNSKVRLEFTVEDTGIGMETEQLENIFQPFEQVGDVKRRASGTGLGLTISRQLVKQMHGELKVSSTLGVGSQFYFALSLPISELPQSQQTNAEDIRGYSGDRKRILIVDDVQANRSLLADTLDMLGFVTKQASNGEEALMQAGSWRPDLILMELVMPVLDGLQAPRQLQQIPALQQTPVIMVSANVTAEELVKGRESGVCGFLGKPVERSELLQLIGGLLHLQWEVLEPAALASKEAVADTCEWTLSAQQLERLHGLALTGNMRDIRSWAEELREENQIYRPFAEKLIELTKAFQSKAILALVEQHMERILSL